jgi:hypothetical protein
MVRGDRTELIALLAQSPVKISHVMERLQHTNSSGDHSLELKANAFRLESLSHLRERILIWHGELQLVSRNRFL